MCLDESRGQDLARKTGVAGLCVSHVTWDLWRQNGSTKNGTGAQAKKENKGGGAQAVALSALGFVRICLRTCQLKISDG